MKEDIVSLVNNIILKKVALVGVSSEGTPETLPYDLSFAEIKMIDVAETSLHSVLLIHILKNDEVVKIISALVIRNVSARKQGTIIPFTITDIHSAILETN